MTSRIYAFPPPCKQYGRQMLSDITRENSTGIISGVMHAKGYYNLSPDFRYIYYHILNSYSSPAFSYQKKTNLKAPPKYIFLSVKAACAPCLSEKVAVIMSDQQRMCFSFSVQTGRVWEWNCNYEGNWVGFITTDQWHGLCLCVRITAVWYSACQEPRDDGTKKMRQTCISMATTVTATLV